MTVYKTPSGLEAHDHSARRAIAAGLSSMHCHQTFGVLLSLPMCDGKLSLLSEVTSQKGSRQMAGAFGDNADEARIVIARVARRLILRFVVAAMTPAVGHAFAQGAFPAPLPGQAAAPPQFDSAPATAGGPSDVCKGFFPLREEAQRRGQLIKAAAERRATPEDACELIRSFSQAELKMIEYVEAHSTDCRIRPDVVDMLKAGHKKTETLQTRVCTIAQSGSLGQSDVLGPPKREPAGPVGDFWMFR
ncbi:MULTISPECIES: hypothetical protein [unclassified Bradyrhizobium]|nr:MULTISPECIES: hypothetical protein [unclassified Bradyrhizobium]